MQQELKTAKKLGQAKIVAETERLLGEEKPKIGAEKKKLKLEKKEVAKEKREIGLEKLDLGIEKRIKSEVKKGVSAKVILRQIRKKAGTEAKKLALEKGIIKLEQVEAGIEAPIMAEEKRELAEEAIKEKEEITAEQEANLVERFDKELGTLIKNLVNSLTKIKNLAKVKAGKTLVMRITLSINVLEEVQREYRRKGTSINERTIHLETIAKTAETFNKWIISAATEAQREDEKNLAEALEKTAHKATQIKQFCNKEVRELLKLRVA